MKKIVPFNVTKASVTRISIMFNDDDSKLDINATVALYTDEGFLVTTVAYSSERWTCENLSIESPIDLIVPAGEIRKIAERLCVAKVNTARKLLG